MSDQEEYVRQDYGDVENNSNGSNYAANEDNSRDSNHGSNYAESNSISQDVDQRSDSAAGGEGDVADQEEGREGAKSSASTAPSKPDEEEERGIESPDVDKPEAEEEPADAESNSASRDVDQRSDSAGGEAGGDADGEGGGEGDIADQEEGREGAKSGESPAPSKPDEEKVIESPADEKPKEQLALNENGPDLPQVDNEPNEVDQEVDINIDDETPTKTRAGRKRKTAPEPEGYEVEAIMDKRTRRKQVEYLIKWVGYSHSENTWEPLRNLSCDELIAAFEDEAAKKGLEDPKKLNRNARASKRQKQEETTTYEAEKILGATEIDGQMMFLLKWKDVEDGDLVPAYICYEKCPKLICKYYEERVVWDDPLPKQEKEEEIDNIENVYENIENVPNGKNEEAEAIAESDPLPEINSDADTNEPALEETPALVEAQ